MKISIIIPAHNEAQFLEQSLKSFVEQTCPPEELIVVDDNSTDSTFRIASDFSKKYNWIKVVQHQSSEQHLPGEKVIRAFNFGLLQSQLAYDLIGKFDADIVLPANYFEKMRNQFKSNWKLGICSGLLYIQKGQDWVYESIANKNHVRGPVKLYHKACFEKMNGLRSGVGWDTVDTLLAKYHDFEVKTDPTLIVKHLRPTGHGYSTKKYTAKGEALYKMRYGLPLAKIALAKMALQSNKPQLYFQGISGYLNAWFTKKEHFVTKEEGAFIRKFRWKGIFNKLS